MIKNYQKLKETINYAISNSCLDIGAVYFILKDILMSVERLYYTQINKELFEDAKENEVKSGENENENNQ